MAMELLAILVVGVLVVNLAVAWLLIHGDHDVRDVLDVEERGVQNGGGEPDIGPDIDPTAAADSGPDGDPPPLSTDGETVICRHCGTENRSGYRYCRWCVRSGFTDSDHANASEPSASQRPF